MSGLYSLLTLDPLHMLFAVQNNVAGIGVVQQCSRKPSKHFHGVAPGRPQCDCLIRCMISYIPPGRVTAIMLPMDTDL